MLRFATSLCCCLLLAASAAAQDAIWHEDDAGLTLYARIYTGGGTAVAVALTPGTSGNTRLYSATVATVEGAGVDLTTELPFTVFQGTPSTSASDTARGSGVVGSAPLVIDEDGLAEMGAAVTEVLLTTNKAAYSSADSLGLVFATLFDKLPSSSRKMAGEGTVAKNLDQVEGGGGGGTSQPRINEPPAKAYTVAVSTRSDGTLECPSPLRLPPGDTNIVFGIDMSPLYGQVRVLDVGEPTVSGGDVTATELGPHDWIAMAQLGGIVTAGERRIITVPVTMRTGETEQVRVKLWGMTEATP